VRVEAIDQIEPEGEGLGTLIERLQNDPHPKVRAAAARQIEDSDTLLSVDALIRALSDPDREVVLQAIDALEFSDDESVANDIALLKSHPDPEIREAAAEAVCFIQDCD
jgi:HEAT repeat protein